MLAWYKGTYKDTLMGFQQRRFPFWGEKRGRPLEIAEGVTNPEKNPSKGNQNENSCKQSITQKKTYNVEKNIPVDNLRLKKIPCTGNFSHPLPRLYALKATKLSTSKHLLFNAVTTLLLHNIFKISGFVVTFLAGSVPFGDNESWSTKITFGHFVLFQCPVKTRFPQVANYPWGKDNTVSFLENFIELQSFIF